MDEPKKEYAASPVGSGSDFLSPGSKSRYGRTRRPKITQDFYNIDDVILDENPPRLASSAKLQKPKSLSQSPVIGAEIVFELKDEFTKLDDLGMKVANNFKSNLQRGLDGSIKERKFFKSMSENKVEVPNIVDVTKVFKLISKPASEVLEAKTMPKSPLKTYTNRRRHVHDSDNFVVESFGLPDEPIVSVKTSTMTERNKSIDVDLDLCALDVNLPSPWPFEFPGEPMFQVSPTDSRSILEENFCRGTMLDLFSTDSLLSENLEVANAFNITEKHDFDKYPLNLTPPISVTAEEEKIEVNMNESHPLTAENSLSETLALIGDRSSDLLIITPETPIVENSSGTVGELEIRETDTSSHDNKLTVALPDSTQDENSCTKTKSKPKSAKKKIKTTSQLTHTPSRILRSTADSIKNALLATPNSSNITSPEVKKTKVLEAAAVSKENSIEVIEILETDIVTGANSSSNDLTLLNTIDLTVDNVSPTYKILRSGPVCNEKSPVAKKTKSLKINKLCPQVRVILNPLALNKFPVKSLKSKTLVPNPFRIKKEVMKRKRSSKARKRDLRSTKQVLNTISESVIGDRKAFKKNNSGLMDTSETEVKIEEADLKDIKNIKIECSDYNVGDLAWAKIGTFPYWPCLITNEPASGEHKKIVIHRSQPFYHVRFFGDKGRRSWVNSQHVMMYCGKNDLEKLARVLKAENRVKAAYIRESYIIKSTQMKKWQDGVDEAETLKSKSVVDRLNYFSEMFAKRKIKPEKVDLDNHEIKEEMIDSSTSPLTNKKRQRLSEVQTEIKKIKLEGIPPLELNDLLIKKEEDEEGSLIPPIKNISPAKSPTKSITMKEPLKSETKKIVKLSLLNKKENERVLRKKTTNLSTQFSTSQEISEDESSLEQRLVEELNERISKTKTEKQQRRNKIVESLDDGVDARKRLRISQGKLDISEVVKKSNETEENEEFCLPKARNKRQHPTTENSDTDSKFSDNSSVPTSLESQAALYRRNNIFRGIPKEKVCQICEVGGEILKCKGPCSGAYHYDCIASIVQPKEGEKNKEVVEKKVEGKVQIVEILAKTSLPKPIPINCNGMTLAEKIDFRMREIMKKFDYQSVYAECPDSSSDDDNQQISNRKAKLESQTLLLSKSSVSKELPIIKHVTADTVSYVCVADEKPNQEEIPTPKDLSKCPQCSINQIPCCLVCNKEESASGLTLRQLCSINRCGKFYHPECLKVWPQTQWSLIQNSKDKDTFVCPRHVCHTCISDDPRAGSSRCPSDKVVKCLRCPATYHSSNCCVPAGSHILSSSQIVCPRHYSQQKPAKKCKLQLTINTNWCFLCSKGGDLICCETCPTSVHKECLPGDLNEADRFFCEDCQSGRLPLYDEIVWVKLGKFRWWPAVILFPNEVPDNVKNLKHNKGEFVVKFFGTYDHYWVSRGRTFLFQEGDKGHSGAIRKKVDSAFVKAIEEASAAHQLKKQFKSNKVAEKNTVLKPPPYIRIKANKPVGNVKLFEGNTSNTTSCDCDPHQPHPCGPDSDCLNRLLMTECNPDVCPAGERCNNQCFEKREYPPLAPHHTESRGWGLKTLAPIRKGQFVIEYVGEMIDDQEYQRRLQKMHEQKEENYYFLTIDKDRTLDAGPKGNVARFMNHSCQPNCETQKWTVNGNTRVGLFASCDIPAGTELTFNYNLESVGKEKKICRCGAPNCSGFIGVKVKTEGALKKANKLKKKRSPPPPAPEPVVINDPCFICQKTGNVGACNNKICTKFYHLECVGLTSWPEGNKWACQWHNCNICSKRTIRCCVKCINSFCPPHSEGYVRYDKLMGFVCTEHDPTKESNVIPVARNSEKIEETSHTEENAVTSTTSEENKVDEDFLDSMSLAVRLNGCATSTPLKKDNQQNVAPSGSQKVKRKKKVLNESTQKTVANGKGPLKNTANLCNNKPEACQLPPVLCMRSSRSKAKIMNITDPQRDLSLRTRTRLRCGNTL